MSYLQCMSFIYSAYCNLLTRVRCFIAQLSGAVGAVQGFFPAVSQALGKFHGVSEPLVWLASVRLALEQTVFYFLLLFGSDRGNLNLCCLFIFHLGYSDNIVS